MCEPVSHGAGRAPKSPGEGMDAAMVGEGADDQEDGAENGSRDRLR